MALTLRQIQDVCLLFSGDYRCCRFLAHDGNPKKWFCMKMTARRAEIDVETDDFIKEMQHKGRDPTRQGMPLGDNCPGYPLLKNLEQGYDLD